MPTPGAPFLGNMGASLSQNGFGSLTSHCESSGMAQIANTGMLTEHFFSLKHKVPSVQFAYLL
jgi:hypothetical protein